MKAIFLHSNFLRCIGFVSAFACLGLVSQSCIAQPANPPASPAPASTIIPGNVLAVMKKVADWQLVNPSASSNRYTENEWTWGACYAGMMALGDISDDPKYRNAMLAVGEKFTWKLAPRLYDADDHCVGQAYAELYLRYRDPKMIAPLREKFDAILARPSSVQSLEFTAPQSKARENWSWCDSLFMGPPVWIRLYAATSDTRYLDFMVTNWWRTTDYLYDKDEHLYFRDSTYFNKREANGKKIFWSRGNGWVMGGLVRVLQYLPNNHPDRPRFEKLFKDMSEKLLTCQQSDGLWRASLLDPDSYPLKETSGSGFHIYAFAWGVNQGLLDRAKFEPAVRTGWTALVDCVQEDGKLTHVQPVGADPKKFDNSSSDVYAVGAFLLAGSEVYKMAVMERTIDIQGGGGGGGVSPIALNKVKVWNTATYRRDNETVEINMKGLRTAHPLKNIFLVIDGLSSRILDSQTYSTELDSEPDRLLFQVDLAANETKTFFIIESRAFAAVPPPIVKTYARPVPERFDDFAWESDRAAHRIFGQGVIKGEGLITSGIDVWSKRTRALVIDRWYKDADYHNDHGEGVDDYRVGRSRGGGGLGVWDGKNLYVSSNYVTGRLITTGPIRSEFELTYGMWDAGGRKISEVKRISIDAGSNLSRAESIFTSDDKSPLQIGVGIAQRPGDGGLTTQNQKDGWMTYWQPEDRDRGHLALAVVLSGGVRGFVVETNSFPAPAPADLTTPAAEGFPPIANQLAIAQAEVGKPFVYYFGAGWSKSGDFPDAAAWNRYVSQFAARLKAPLKVSIESR